MPFTTEEREKILEALKQKGVPEQCPVCKQGELRVSNYIAFVPVRERHVEVGGNAELDMVPVGDLPCIIVVCLNCGNTLMFSLSRLGLWDEFVGELEAAWGRRR